MRGGASYTELLNLSVIEFSAYLHVLGEILAERDDKKPGYGGEVIDLTGSER